MNRSNSGFTLIELLVVIAIIAVLAAIVFPVFSAAREAAKKTNCIGNMKQIGGALTMYRDDFDGVNPGIWSAGSIGDNGVFWHSLA